MLTTKYQEAAEALQFIDPGTDRNTWFKTLAAAKAAGLDFDDVLAWSALAANFKSERDVMAAWRGIDAHGAIQAGTLFHAARANGWKPSEVRKQSPKPARTQGALTRTQKAEHPTLSDHGQQTWSDGQPVHSIGAMYLTARQCVIPPEDGDLRYHPALKHPGGYVGPALVALVSDTVTRQPISLHRTWIKADGTKADIDPPRMLLGGHRKQGGVIRLWPNEAVTMGLAVCEGVETALSLAHAYAPIWSCLDAGNLAALPVLAGIETLVVGADNDQAGIKAANECAQRWADAGVDVLVTQQTENDLNDVLRRAA